MNGSPKEKQLTLFDSGVMSASQVLDGMNQDLRNDARTWPSLLAELVDVLADHYQDREKANEEKAMAMAQDVIVVIAHHLGGRSVYLPRDDRLKRAIRDSMIHRAFDGTNHLALARRAGLTTTQIYNIIERQRRLRQDRLQMKLPFPE
jgi:Mor family transcriptional regulator